MVRSICKRALVGAMCGGLVLAWAGLGRSQQQAAPRPTSTEASSERILTVHDNGKAIRCRVLASWRTGTGARAFDLEVLDNGERITLVEDGPEASFSGKAGGLTALPMRIYHWAQSRTRPEGFPAPSTLAVTGSPVVTTTAPPPVPPGNMVNEGMPRVVDALSPCCVEERPRVGLRLRERLQTALAPRVSGIPQVIAVDPAPGAALAAQPSALDSYPPVPAAEDDRPRTERPKLFSRLGREAASRTTLGPPTDGGRIDVFQQPDRLHPHAIASMKPMVDAKGSPIGIKSVLAARSGMPGELDYVPVPMVSIPAPNRSPHMAQIQGPQDGWVNAFRPPAYGATSPMDRPATPPHIAQAVHGMNHPSPFAHLQNAAMDRRGAMGAGSQSPITPEQIAQCVATLRDALGPAQREMATMSLSSLDARMFPQIAMTLLNAAKSDPAPSVRAACCHGLAKMNANGEGVLSTLEALRFDPDPRVRFEAEQALIRLQPR